MDIVDVDSSIGMSVQVVAMISSRHMEGTYTAGAFEPGAWCDVQTRYTTPHSWLSSVSVSLQQRGPEPRDLDNTVELVRTCVDRSVPRRTSSFPASPNPRPGPRLNRKLQPPFSIVPIQLS